jgi:chemotaxis protein MotB
VAKKKRAEEEEKENAERWLLTYSDMITLLMLFFVVLYSMSNIDAAKYEQMSEALGEVFGSPNIGMLFTDIAGKSGNIGLLDKSASGEAAKKAEGSKSSTASGKSQLQSKAVSMLQSLIQKGKARVVSNENGVAISLAADISFASGSAALSSDAIPMLQEVADFLIQLPNNIVVEGHSDNKSVDAGKFGSNWDLSSQRALAVLQALEAYGVKSERLSATAYGSTRPMRSNDTPEGRSYNRRVDIVIVEKE